MTWTTIATCSEAQVDCECLELLVIQVAAAPVCPRDSPWEDALSPCTV